MKWKYIGSLFIALFFVMGFTTMTSQAATEYQVGEIKSTSAKWYTSPSKTSTAKSVTSTDRTRAYSVDQSTKADGTTYYRLKQGTTTRGWVDVKYLSLKKRTIVSKEKKTLYLLGKGYSYELPSTKTANREYILTTRAGKAVSVDQYEKFGTSYWYRGKISGTTKTVWIRSTYLTNQTPEYQVGEIKSTSAKWYTSPSKTSTAKSVTSTDRTRAYSVDQSAKADGTTYYRLKQGTTTRGWVDVKYLNLKQRTIVSKEKKTLYLLGNGYSYELPSTKTANREYILTKRRGYEVAVDQYEKFGTSYWYRGKISGTTKTVWIRSTYMTSNGYVGVDLRKPSNVTAKDLQALILAKGRTPDNILYKLAPEFIKAQSSTGVSAQFMFAHAILETGWGGSTISQYKNNLFGYQAYDTCPVTCAQYFPTGEDGLKLYASKIVNNYLTPTGPYYNGKNVLDMNVRYATDKSWGEKIAGLMVQIKPFNSSYYKGVAASTKTVSASANYSHIIPSNKPQPSVFVTLPTGLVGTANAGAGVYKMPYIYAAKLGTYSTGQSVTIVARHTDVKDLNSGQTRWYRVNYNGQQGWIRSDQVKTVNLAFATVDANLRTNAGTNYSQSGSIKSNTGFRLVKKSGAPVTKKGTDNKTWYQMYKPGTMTKSWIRSDLMKIYR